MDNLEKSSTMQIVKNVSRNLSVNSKMSRMYSNTTIIAIDPSIILPDSNINCLWYLSNYLTINLCKYLIYV
jgi:hypothetical protein